MDFWVIKKLKQIKKQTNLGFLGLKQKKNKPMVSLKIVTPYLLHIPMGIAKSINKKSTHNKGIFLFNYFMVKICPNLKILIFLFLIKRSINKKKLTILNKNYRNRITVGTKRKKTLL